jgi:hypothetical protein
MFKLKERINKIRPFILKQTGNKNVSLVYFSEPPISDNRNFMSNFLRADQNLSGFISTPLRATQAVS